MSFPPETAVILATYNLWLFTNDTPTKCYKSSGFCFLSLAGFWTMQAVSPQCPVSGTALDVYSLANHHPNLQDCLLTRDSYWHKQLGVRACPSPSVVTARWQVFWYPIHLQNWGFSLGTRSVFFQTTLHCSQLLVWGPLAAVWWL